ncbi:MAG: hypothetical protein RBQ97_06385, partial [Acholeplasma sp.]|nr:hypothetical protein [Acholeplasma sp.]
IIGIYGLFIIIYMIIYPFEAPFYYKSRYYKDLKEKYYLLITRKASYKRYNTLTNNEDFNLHIVDDEVKHEDNFWIIGNIKIDGKKDLKDIYVINKKFLSKEDLLLASNEEKFIIYDN